VLPPLACFSARLALSFVIQQKQITKNPMNKFKVPADDKGNYYKECTFKLVEADFVGVKDGQAKVFVKLVKPSGAHGKLLTLRINGKTLNVTKLESGKSVLVGPFPLKVGDNKISFEGDTDKPKQDLEFEVTPQLLK
jgi:hypothetical protein